MMINKSTGRLRNEFAIKFKLVISWRTLDLYYKLHIKTQITRLSFACLAFDTLVFVYVLSLNSVIYVIRNELNI